MFLLMEVQNAIYECGFDQKKQKEKKVKSVPEEVLIKYLDQSTTKQELPQKGRYRRKVISNIQAMGNPTV